MLEIAWLTQPYRYCTFLFIVVVVKSLQTYCFKIKFIPGAENIDADFLWRYSLSDDSDPDTKTSPSGFKNQLKDYKHQLLSQDKL